MSNDSSKELTPEQIAENIDQAIREKTKYPTATSADEWLKQQGNLQANPQESDVIATNKETMKNKDVLPIAEGLANGFYELFFQHPEKIPTFNDAIIQHFKENRVHKLPYDSSLIRFVHNNERYAFDYTDVNGERIVNVRRKNAAQAYTVSAQERAEELRNPLYWEEVMEVRIDPSKKATIRYGNILDNVYEGEKFIRPDVNTKGAVAGATKMLTFLGGRIINEPPPPPLQRIA